MALTVHAIFDGEVLRPEESVSLEPNKRYRLTVEEDANAASNGDKARPYPLSELLEAADDLGIADMAEQHDRYTRRR